MRPRAHHATAAGLIAGGLVIALPAVVFGPIASASVPTGWTEVTRDSFTRQAGNWGTPDVGASYKTVPSVGTEIGTDGARAFAKIASGKGVNATLGGRELADVNVSDTTTFAVPASTTFDYQHSWVVRQQADGSAYTARVRVNQTGKASLGVSRLNGSTATWLSGITLPFTVSPGQQVSGEMQVTGVAPVVIQLRAWLDFSTTPAWQVTHSDSDPNRISSAGTVMLSDFVNSSSATVTVQHDDLSVGSSDSGIDTVPEPEPAPSSEAPPPSPSAEVPSAGQQTPQIEPQGPTPAPSPNTPVTSREVRGSAAVGTARYPIPTTGSVFFVDAVKGSNTNVGTQAAPFKTVVYAATKAKSGATLVLRKGTYHESLTVAANKTIAIQNYPGEAVWFDGSVPVTKWAKSGAAWVSTGWMAEFSDLMGSTTTGVRDRYTGGGANAIAASPDQVFVNGAPLRQVSSAAAVTAGKFHVNDGGNTLTIGTDPAGKEVRASDLPFAMYLAGVGSSVRGIGIRRFANGYEHKGALRIGNVGGTIENVIVEDVATIGISVSGVKKTVNHVTVRRAGLLGIGGNQNDNSRFTHSIVSGNNTEAFKNEPVAGGVKLTSARTIRIDNIEASNNNGTGIWLDVSSYNMTVVNNTTNNNTKHGIELEISDTGIVANNTARGGEDGIIIFDTGNVKLFNNEVGGSQLFGIKLAQDERRQADLGKYPEARDPRTRGVDPTVPFINKNIQLSNNVFGNGGLFQLYALDGRTNRAVDTWNLTINGNLFTKRVAKTDPTVVAWGKGDNKTLERYETSEALAAAKNVRWRNALTTTSKAVTTMGPDKVANTSVAVPLPADVAEAIGTRSGQKILGNF